jgi:hypothetical protein
MSPMPTADTLSADLTGHDTPEAIAPGTTLAELAPFCPTWFHPACLNQTSTPP